MGPNSEKDEPQSRASDSGALKSVAQAESLMQIAFVLPSGLLVGLGMGWCVDHFLHWHWAIIVGMILGLVAGMVSVIRTATQVMNSVAGRGKR